MDYLLGSKAGWDGQGRSSSEAKAPGGADGAGAALLPTGLMGPIPRLPAGKASFPNMVCSLLRESHPVRGAGHPTHPPPMTPEHRATPLGPLSPCPGDHRKCQQSESQENSPPAQSKGAGCRQRGMPLRGPSPLRGRLAEGLRPGPAGHGWALREAGELCQGQGPAGGGRGWREGPLDPGELPRELPGPLVPRVASSHLLGMSSMSSQGQFQLQLYSPGRPEPVWEAPLRVGTWHQAPGTRSSSACVSWCPPPPAEPPRQALRSPGHCWRRRAPAGQAPPLWAPKPLQLLLTHFSLQC